MPINLFFQSCEELFSGRTGTPFDANGTREYLRRFRVMVTNLGKTLGPIGVTTCPGLPLAYSPYQTRNGEEYDLLALLVKADAQQEHDDDWQSWIINCRYSTRMPDGGAAPGAINSPNERPSQGGAAMNNPEFEPPDMEWDFEVVQKALPHDLDGKPFWNSARQPFSPPPTFEQAYPVLVYSRNELNFDIKIARRYAFAVNSDVFLDAKPGTAQCMPPKARQVHRGPLRYWRVTYRIRFGPPKADLPNNKVDGGGKFGDVNGKLVEKLNEEFETWQPKILDQGTMETDINPDGKLNGKLKPIIRYGVPVTQPVLLNGNGLQLRPNAAGEMEPTFIDFRVFHSRPFNKILQTGFTP